MRRDLAHCRDVRRSPFKCEEIVRRHPPHLSVLRESGCARNKPTPERRECYVAEVVGMCGSRHLVAYIHDALQLLDDLTFECHTRRFARLDLPTGELPISGKAARRTALRTQDGPVMHDHSTDHADLLTHCRPPRTQLDGPAKQSWPIERRLGECGRERALT